ncbi:MAG: DUF4845 domain-containing protein [Candidatus Methylumidiphilus sp.]
MNNRLSQQNGLTLISFLVIFTIFGFFVLLVLKLAPIYLEHFKVTTSLEAIKKEPGVTEKSPREIAAMLQKRWDVNDINRITVDKSVVIEKRPDSLKVVVDYEVEEHIMANVSALVKFNDSFTLSGQ